MNRYILAISLLAIAIPVNADRNVTVTIRGVDAVCNTFTPSSDGSSVILTCAQSANPGAPTGCVATSNGQVSTVALPSSGGQVTFAVTCVSPTSGLTYNWSRNGASGASMSPTWSDKLAQNTS